MFRSKSCRLFSALFLCVLISACATSEDETVADRRANGLEQDNVSLKKQIEDLNAVEVALNRELESEKNSSVQRQNSDRELSQENVRLRAQVAQLRADLENASKTTEEIRPVSQIETSGLSGRDIEVVEKSDGSVAVRVGGTAMFKTGQDTLTRSGMKVLDRVGSFLKSRGDLQVSVEGHTDATPLGKTQSIWGTNLALSLARAMAVQDYLRAKQNISEKRMRVVGYGEHRPLVPGTSKAANAKNRRVEIVLHANSI